MPREPYLSPDAVAEILGVSTDALYGWLRLGRELGVRFELLPLLPIAYEQLAQSPRRDEHDLVLLERLVLTPDGVEPLEVADRFEHARVDRHWEAAVLALAGDTLALRRFRGLSVNGVELVSDCEQLRAWAASLRLGRLG